MGVAALHHPEAERALLAAALLDPRIAEQLARELQPADLVDQRHAAILRALCRLHGAGRAFDLRTAQADLEARGELPAAGGLAYLAGLDEDLPDLGRVDEYLQVVRDATARRSLLASCQSAARRLETGAEFEAVMGGLSADLRSIEATASTDRLAAIGDAFAGIEHRLANPIAAGKAGIPSGFPDLDRLTLGWSAGQLIVVAARPGVGKTALACAFAKHAASEGIPALFVSLEMGREELAQRFLSADTGVGLSRIRTGYATREEAAHLRESMAWLREQPLYLEEPASLAPSRLSAMLRKAKREHGIRLAVVDYLGLMRPDDGSRMENQNLRVAEISRALKCMAKELGIALVALHQLNRASEKRDDKRPVLSDLRDSGAVEQDADLVLFIYREQPASPEDRNAEAELILAKHRNGPVDTVRVRQRLDVFRFEPIPALRAAG